MSIRFVALETSVASALRSGAPDANGQPAEQRLAPVEGYPCRHCLGPIAKGAPFLVLAYRPFPAPQPYAEVGPIFLHADSCPRGGGGESIPRGLASAHYIVRGYGEDDRIVYGTGGIVATDEIPDRAASLLTDPAVAYVHVRSAANNCYQCRIDRV